MDKKAAILIHTLTDNNFLSGAGKVNIAIVKTLVDLGYKLDLFCQEYDISDKTLFEHIYKDKMEEFYKNKDEYLFSFSEQACIESDFSYIHENTRYYRNKYLRKDWQKILSKIFTNKHYKKTQRILKNSAKSAKLVNTILVPSEFIKQDIMEAYGKTEEDIRILPPFCENNVSDFAKEKHDVFTFGLSARGFENKGGYDFLTALILLKLKGINCRGLIIYPFSKTAKKLQFLLNNLGFKDNIKFIDYCENMNDFYKEIDCLVMASKREAFGLVATEAIARKIPVLINTRCGVKDFIVNNETGFIYEYDKPVLNLYNSMKYILQNQDILPKITSNALKITEELSYENFKTKLKNIIEEKIK